MTEEDARKLQEQADRGRNLRAVNARLVPGTHLGQGEAGKLNHGAPVKPTAKKTEHSIMLEIRQALSFQGWYVTRIHQSLGSMKGICDLTAIKNGVTIYIEAKAPKGKLSKWQEEYMRNITEHGGIFIVARSYEDIANCPAFRKANEEAKCIKNAKM